MVDAKRLERGVDAGAHDGGGAMVHSELLNKFEEIVTQLGGDPLALLAKVQIEPASLSNRHAVIPHRTFVRLLERASADLSCPDFGMRLAAAQGGVKVVGPLGYVMRNSRTVREAFRYCIEYVQVYSTAAQMCFEDCSADGSVFLRIESFVAKQSNHPQTHERALLLTQRIASNISDGQVRAEEIWFTHEPLSPTSTYRDYFGCTVRFGQSMNGVLFADRDLDTPIPKADPQVYELATNYIEQRLPATDSLFGPRIRLIVERLLLAGKCTHNGVASMLGMHPRALQRRLRAEGESFEAIKDSVRREIALRYLKQSSIPLIRVAKMLGYSETSALSRSCYRWFSASPRQLRQHALKAQEPAARSQSLASGLRAQEPV
jgi:AraC-like DNA-binding protein